MSNTLFIIDVMKPGDLDAVIEVEKDCLSGWTRAQLEDELQQDQSWSYVVRRETDNRIVAYACGRSLNDEAELLKLTVKKNARRQGIASMLLHYALGSLEAEGVRSCFLEVRSSNSSALSLYEKIGFTRIGLRPRYYKNPAEDAVIMKITLPAEL